MSELKTIHVLSLGAGVQSSTLALMFAAGEAQTCDGSPLDAAIFADTGAEPQSVYDWLDWLEARLPFPVYRVRQKEGLLAALQASACNKSSRVATPPLFSSPSGQLMRQCTSEYKIVPLTRKLRELIQLKYRQRAPKGRTLAHVYLGISLDEAQRMKPNRETWAENHWPLVDHRMRRSDCLRWMEANGYPKPPRSACTFCPFHSDAEWQWLKDNEPEAFAQAVEVDRMIRGGIRGTKGQLYLHRSMQPLEDVEFSDRRQLDMWSDECEGMCGL